MRAREQESRKKCSRSQRRRRNRRESVGGYGALQLRQGLPAPSRASLTVDRLGFGGALLTARPWRPGISSHPLPECRRHIVAPEAVMGRKGASYHWVRGFEVLPATAHKPRGGAVNRSGSPFILGWERCGPQRVQLAQVESGNHREVIPRNRVSRKFCQSSDRGPGSLSRAVCGELP